MVLRNAKQKGKTPLKALKRYSAGLLASVALMGMIPAESWACSRWNFACKAREAVQRVARRAADEARKVAEREAEEARQRAEREAEQARRTAAQAAEDARLAAERAAEEARRTAEAAAAAAKQEMVDLVGNILLAEKYIRAVERLIRGLESVVDFRGSWESMLPEDSKNLMKLLVNQKSSNNASSSQTTAENQNDEKHSQALKAFFPDGTFEENQDRVIPLKDGSGNTNFMVVPRQPYVDGGGGGDDNSNYKYSDKLKIIETTSVSTDMAFSYWNNAKVAGGSPSGMGAVAYSSLLMASSQKINGIQQPTYFITNNPLKVSFGLDMGPHINFAREVDVFWGGSMGVNWTCTVNAKCMTRSIKAQLIMDVELNEILTAMAKAKVLSRFIKFVKGTRAPVSTGVTRTLENLEVGLSGNAQKQSSQKAAGDNEDGTTFVDLQPSHEEDEVEDVVSQGELTKLADQTIELTRKVSVSDSNSFESGLTAAANSGKPLYREFAKVGLGVAKRAAGKTISIGNSSALTAVDPLVVVPIFQMVGSVFCPILQAVNETKDAVTGLASTEFGIGCLDENIIETQISFTWLNNRWATNPDGEIQQGWHPKPGDQSPDLFGLNLVLYSTTGAQIYVEWPYGAIPPDVILSHRLSLKFRLANPQTIGFFWPLTYNGGLEPK